MARFPSCSSVMTAPLCLMLVILLYASQELAARHYCLMTMSLLSVRSNAGVNFILMRCHTSTTRSNATPWGARIGAVNPLLNLVAIDEAVPLVHRYSMALKHGLRR